MPRAQTGENLPRPSSARDTLTPFSGERCPRRPGLHKHFTDVIPERSLEAQFQTGRRALAWRSHSTVARRPAADAAIASARTKVRNEKRCENAKSRTHRDSVRA